LRITEEKLGKSTFLRLAREIAYTHQEKWDGSGYPRRLKGEEIPLSGRLMALADVYDALISKRVYKPPMPHEDAVRIIADGTGCHFDPDVVEAFLELQTVFRNIALIYADFAEERETLGSGLTWAEPPGKGITHVLLAEDNAINLEIMKNQLASLGFSVVAAASGLEALSTYQAMDFDLVLTDIDMPGIDGFKLADAIRRMGKEGRTVPPILAITASEFELTEASAKSAGFDGYMLKPLDLGELKKKLSAYFYPIGS
jgi:putative two-component system response regulator